MYIQTYLCTFIVLVRLSVQDISKHGSPTYAGHINLLETFNFDENIRSFVHDTLSIIQVTRKYGFMIF